MGVDVQALNTEERDDLRVETGTSESIEAKDLSDAVHPRDVDRDVVMTNELNHQLL